MEERKFDPYQFIGFILIAIILTWMLYQNQPQEGVSQDTSMDTTELATPKGAPSTVVNDSIAQIVLQNTYGDLAAFMQERPNEIQTLRSDKLLVQVDSKGGNLIKVQLTEFENYQSEPLQLIADNNTELNIEIPLRDGRVLNSRDFYFTPTLTKQGDTEVLTLTSGANSGMQLVMDYIINPSSYLIDFQIRSTGLGAYLRTEGAQLQWSSQAFRNSKSLDYENRYTELSYQHRERKVDELGISGSDEETVDGVQWVSFRQHFFSAILISETPLDRVELTSDDLSQEESLEEKFTKNFKASIPLALQTNGEFSNAFQWYFGPTDFKTLKSYNLGLEDSVPLGWGIFGWINRFIFLPLFSFLGTFFPTGIAIIVLTILVRLAMSPVTYKAYVSQIKMKVLRPEVEEINAKHKDNAVKKQQETMSLYGKAGVNPMSGCVPALLQMPVFFALFTFFPVAFTLRQKSFLWADDLSSYDSVLDLPFSIPFYGDHVSLFPILASVAIFFYTQMTTGQQAMPQQPGMPNMKVIMYLMPLMMLFFFNNYASGLSLYYFISNLITIVLMLVIKNFIVDNDKIHAQIEENKKKPKKSGGFSARLQKAMQEAEKQQRARGKK
ncbi:MAG TPA: membrane protein insertase YidC [Flavobacteriaceae bacterium]|nr:membrane protein insertase YidC [Flavobacteriaceae bacterium]|tara:strand:- start:34521 stop:36350 length:1830 start_codon:yes stop_codon:yes gene_type:complete